MASSWRSYDLTDSRHRDRIVSFLEALDSQQPLYASQQTQVDVHLVEASNGALLFKALGGDVGAQP